MQIIYAAPFVLLSILSFVICLAIPKLRHFSLPALIAPVAFGVCSIVGWISFILISQFVFRISLGPAAGLGGVVEGLLFYLAPGLFGAWLAVKAVRALDQRLLTSTTARDVLLALAIGAVSAGISGVTGLGLATAYMAPGSVVASWWIALGAFGFGGLGAYVVARVVQNRHHVAKMKASGRA